MLIKAVQFIGLLVVGSFIWVLMAEINIPMIFACVIIGILVWAVYFRK